MKPFVYSVQYISEKNNFEVTMERGLLFCDSYSNAAKTIEAKRANQNESIIDMYISLVDKEIQLSEETYEKLLNGDVL